ncbi:unnamed protein product [Pleuronectes platessa]|uniref:Uncharacterized protein n=1 Tax=Pleuronectes platessa TaxID=8262 RepID=A0A9N7Z8M8_PLEPL|nr:unnamed protein product [Pleuronectes platessa]
MSNPFSGAAFAVVADILSCGAKRRSCLRVFFSSVFGFLPKLLHMPKLDLWVKSEEWIRSLPRVHLSPTRTTQQEVFCSDTFTFTTATNPPHYSGTRGKESTDSTRRSAVRAGSEAAERAVLMQLEQMPLLRTEKGSTGDRARLIRLPLSSPNEFTVIEYGATPLLSSSLSLLNTLLSNIHHSLGGFHCKY